MADQPHVVHEAVGEFTKTLMEAVIIVLGVSFLALGWRPGVVVAIAIPLVLAITFVVMDLLGISLRHLHSLFETTGTSFTRVVTAERMKQSRRLLTEAPERPVSQITLACGFESLATFYRIFHAAHGMPPGDFRAQSRAV